MIGPTHPAPVCLAKSQVASTTSIGFSHISWISSKAPLMHPTSGPVRVNIALSDAVAVDILSDSEQMSAIKPPRIMVDAR
jgi:hypothetical protein